MKNFKIMVGIGATALLLPLAAQAESVADFYKGKTIDVYSGHSKGGAYSAYARMVTRHIGRHIPGNPTGVFRLKPGASGMVLAHWLNAAAPKDGLSIGTFHERVGMEPLIAPGRVKFDGRDFTWLGSIARNVSICFTWGPTNLKTLEDVKKQTVVAGAGGTVSTDAVMARVMNFTLGTKFKVISGYRGADILLALQRGEVQARCGFGYPSLKGVRPEWLTGKKIHMLAQLTTKSHPEITQVPLLIDLVKPEHKAAVELAGATGEMGRPYAAPPGLPKDRADALRNAFMAMVKDKDFLAEANRLKLEISPIDGPSIQALLDRLYKTPKEVTQQVVLFRTPGSDEKRIKRKKKKKKPEAK